MKFNLFSKVLQYITSSIYFVWSRGKIISFQSNNSGGLWKSLCNKQLGKNNLSVWVANISEQLIPFTVSDNRPLKISVHIWKWDWRKCYSQSSSCIVMCSCCRKLIMCWRCWASQHMPVTGIISLKDVLVTKRKGMCREEKVWT